MSPTIDEKYLAHSLCGPKRESKKSEEKHLVFRILLQLHNQFAIQLNPVCKRSLDKHQTKREVQKLKKNRVQKFKKMDKENTLELYSVVLIFLGQHDDMFAITDLKTVNVQRVLFRGQ